MADGDHEKCDCVNCQIDAFVIDYFGGKKKDPADLLCALSRGFVHVFTALPPEDQETVMVTYFSAVRRGVEYLNTSREREGGTLH